MGVGYWGGVCGVSVWYGGLGGGPSDMGDFGGVTVRYGFFGEGSQSYGGFLGGVTVRYVFFFGGGGPSHMGDLGGGPGVSWGLLGWDPMSVRVGGGLSHLPPPYFSPPPPFLAPTRTPHPDPIMERPPSRGGDPDPEPELEGLLGGASGSPGEGTSENDPPPVRPLSPTRLQPLLPPEARADPEFREVARVLAQMPRPLRRRGSMEQCPGGALPPPPCTRQYQKLITRLLHRPPHNAPPGDPESPPVPAEDLELSSSPPPTEPSTSSMNTPVSEGGSLGAPPFIRVCSPPQDPLEHPHPIPRVLCTTGISGCPPPSLGSLGAPPFIRVPHLPQGAPPLSWGPRVPPLP